MTDLKINGFEIPEDVRYTKEHEWIRMENEKLGRMGITDYAQKMLKEISFVYLPARGLSVTRVEVICKIESIKAVIEIYSPITGKIVEVNKELKKRPYLINDDPYHKGWLVAIRPSKLKDESSLLLTPKQYAEYVAELIKIDENLLIYRWKKFKA